jgi:hypothetical protein
LGQRPDLLAHTYRVFHLDTDPTVLLRSNGSQLQVIEDQGKFQAEQSNLSPVFVVPGTNNLVDAYNVPISTGGTSYSEYNTFADLPAPTSVGLTVVVITATGVPFINKKAAGLYRADGAVWVYLGPVPEGYFSDNVLRFYDNIDASKQAAFELGGITAATTRTYNFPDKNGTLACLDDVTPGPQGPQGIQGIQGIQGPIGNDGPQGIQGIQGIQGPQGDTGPQGIQGIQGDPGTNGSVGPAGPGVVTGGSTGQVLAKVNATDYNTQWVNPPVGLPAGGTAGQSLVKIDATDYNAQWATLGSTASADASWKFSTTTAAADPGNKTFRLNNASLAAVTAIYFNDTTENGFDISTIASFLASGNRIYIQQGNDASKAALFQVSGGAVVDNVGWWTVPVSVVNQGGVLYDNNASCAAIFVMSAGGGGGGGLTLAETRRLIILRA